MFSEEKPKTVLTPATEVWYNMSEMKKVFIGVDPGKDGCLAVIDGGGKPIFRVFFDEEGYVDAVKAYGTNAAIAVLEHVGGIPGQSAPAAFNFGDNFGFTRGLLRSYGVPYELVRPQKWKKEFSCTSDKNTSIQVAKRLFPGLDLHRTEKCVKDHDGCAEAFLMAEYGRRHFNG